MPRSVNTKLFDCGASPSQPWLMLNSYGSTPDDQVFAVPERSPSFCATTTTCGYCHSYSGFLSFSSTAPGTSARPSLSVLPDHFDAPVSSYSETSAPATGAPV